jgi:ADP-heptose:LPS heptosyltransferase
VLKGFFPALSPKFSPKGFHSMRDFRYLKKDRKTGYWNYRRPIPEALQELAGKREKWISFATADERAAKRQWPKIIWRWKLG